MSNSSDRTQGAAGDDSAPNSVVRDPFADPAALIDLRRRPMSERLALALSWNKLAAELRAGVKAAEAKPKRAS